MKKALILAFAVMMLSAVAFAGPSLNPWFEVASEGIVIGHEIGYIAAPTLEAGVIVEGMLSPSWFIDLGITYVDIDLLDVDNDVGFGFESNIGFDELATVNTTGSLVYGCLLSFACDVTYNADYPGPVEIISFTPGFVAEGYVGPLTVWGGVDFPLIFNQFGRAVPLALDFVPTFGIRVDFEINL